MTAFAQHCHQNDTTDLRDALHEWSQFTMGSQKDIATRWLDMILYAPFKTLL